MYSQTVLNHFTNPRNVGDLKQPDATGSAKNQADGDQVQLHLRIRDGIIADVKMRVMGCVAAIASSSLFTEMIKGKSVDEALAISKEDLSLALGTLPENKIRCSLTCIDALNDALRRGVK